MANLKRIYCKFIISYAFIHEDQNILSRKNSCGLCALFSTMPLLNSVSLLCNVLELMHCSFSQSIKSKHIPFTILPLCCKNTTLQKYRELRSNANSNGNYTLCSSASFLCAATFIFIQIYKRLTLSIRRTE